MRVVAIVQARMGSTRLPGKVLMDIAGEPMLALVVRRTQMAVTVRDVVVATTTSTRDDPIGDLCTARGWPCFRGKEEDVLDRYYHAAITFKADAVVRITSDCPLIDPELVDAVVTAFREDEPDYASNILTRTYPRGLDTEVFTFPALEKAWREAGQPYERAHVTPYIFQNPQLFKLLAVTGAKDLSAYRWTVDTLEDLLVARAIYTKLGSASDVSWRQALVVMQDNPELVELNRAVQQKEVIDG